MMEPASEGAPTPTTALPSTFERARTALPSRKRLVQLSHYFDLLGITGAQKAISDAATLSGDDEGAVRGALRGKDPRSANFQQKRRR